MTALDTVRDGLKARLATISGLRAHDTVPEKISPPAAIVSPQTGTYDAYQGGGIDWTFQVRLLTQLGSFRTAQDALDAYIDDSGASSVKAAIEGDLTLGGAVSDVRVASFSDYGLLELGGVQYASVTFTVEVMV